MELDKAALQTELERIDKIIGRPVNIIYMIFMVLGICSVIVKIYVGDASEVFLYAMMFFYSAALLVQLTGLFAIKKSKEVVMGMHGLRCQNCHKTPSSRQYSLNKNHNFCPHCQLKYWVDTENTA